MVWIIMDYVEMLLNLKKKSQHSLFQLFFFFQDFFANKMKARMI